MRTEKNKWDLAMAAGNYWRWYCKKSKPKEATHE